MPETGRDVLIDSVPDIPQSILEIVGHALDKGKTMLEEEKAIVPFTAVLVKDKALVELQPGNSPEECMVMARHAVQGMKGARAYAFCYDGYIDTNQGVKDAIIAEGGEPGESEGYALAYLYEVKEVDGNGDPVDIEVDATPTYIGKAGNLMADLKNDSDAVAKYDYEEKGEQLEKDNAEEFGEPLKDVETTLDKGAQEELDNAKDFGEPLK